MEHFGEFIDYDEGRDIDPREAFYAHALPCESCGMPCEETHPASWDTSLHVGPCCELDLSQIPDMGPSCEALHKLVMRCKTVGEVADAFTAHRKACRQCNPELPEELREAA
jgi:hypothetical protein